MHMDSEDQSLRVECRSLWLNGVKFWMVLRSGACAAGLTLTYSTACLGTYYLHTTVDLVKFWRVFEVRCLRRVTLIYSTFYIIFCIIYRAAQCSDSPGSGTSPVLACDRSAESAPSTPLSLSLPLPPRSQSAPSTPLGVCHFRSALTEAAPSTPLWVCLFHSALSLPLPHTASSTGLCGSDSESAPNSSTGLQHPSFLGGRCRKAMLGVRVCPFHSASSIAVPALSLPLPFGVFHWPERHVVQEWGAEPMASETSDSQLSRHSLVTTLVLQSKNIILIGTRKVYLFWLIDYGHRPASVQNSVCQSWQAKWLSVKGRNL